MHRFMRRPRATLLLAVAALLGGAGGAAAQPEPPIAIPRATVALDEPCTAEPGTLPEIASSGGVLRGTLTMAPATYTLGGEQVTTNVYNGRYNAPTLRVGLGERVELTVVNRMRAVGGVQPADVDITNQHYHGLVVTPIPPAGDNVTHVAIPQRGRNVNHYPLLPADSAIQSQGLMWYHPHPHGHTLPQVAGGLAGAMVVGSLLDSFPHYREATERILVIKSSGGPPDPVLNINGVQCPRLTVTAEQELWRILNATGNTFLNLKLQGYTFTVLAFDGNAVISPIEQDSLFVPPGGRVEAILTAGTGPAVASLVAAPFLKSPDTATVKIAEVHVAQPPAERVSLLQARARAARGSVNQALADSIRRLATATDVDTFTLHYRFGPGTATLNDSVYDPTRLDRAVEVGRVQEWTLVNHTKAPHTFHIHQTDFLITSINGIPVEADSVFFDNVTVGVHEENGSVVGDTVTVRFAFHPVAVGPFVYHCHVLLHEDLGMMQNICVYNPGERDTCDQWFPPGGSAAHSH